MPNAKRLLVISQVYVPDPASVGQHMADAAEDLVARGYAVRVFTSRRGYADPSVSYPGREQLNGVDVVRLPLSSFGKRSIAHRLLGQILYLAQALVRGLFTRNLAGVVVSTSPPMASVVAIVIGFFRRVPLKYWVMDLNPDQMIEMEKISERSLPARAFDFLNRLILRRATDVVALDRFMADRLLRKVNVPEKIATLPPWTHADVPELVPHDENPFRQEHGLEGKFVVMYSGNHGLLLPLDTLLQTSLRLQDDPRFVFMFIGDGARKQEVESFIQEHQPPNVVSLPYQPFETLKYSLSAADVHTVTMTDNMVGVIHPCKIYGAMGVGRPVLFVGPEPSHVTDLLDEYECGWRIAHGDVDQAERILRAAAEPDSTQCQTLGRNAKQAMAKQVNAATLRKQFCDVMTRGLPQP